MVSVDLTARTDLRTADEFRELVIREQNGAIVRLATWPTSCWALRTTAHRYGSTARPPRHRHLRVADANSLDVIKAVRATWDPRSSPVAGRHCRTSLRQHQGDPGAIDKSSARSSKR